MPRRVMQAQLYLFNSVDTDARSAAYSILRAMPRRLLAQVERRTRAVAGHSLGLRGNLDRDPAAGLQRIQHEPVQPELGRPLLSRS